MESSPIDSMDNTPPFNSLSDAAESIEFDLLSNNIPDIEPAHMTVSNGVPVPENDSDEEEININNLIRPPIADHNYSLQHMHAEPSVDSSNIDGILNAPDVKQPVKWQIGQKIIDRGFVQYIGTYMLVLIIAIASVYNLTLSDTNSALWASTLSLVFGGVAIPQPIPPKDFHGREGRQEDGHKHHWSG